MKYGFYETILNIRNLLITKLFYRKSRLIRFPTYIRGKKKIDFGKGLTIGYHCRFEVVDNNLEDKQLIFGEECRLGDRVHITAFEKVTLGNNVLVASNVLINATSHGSYSGDVQCSPKSIPSERELISKPITIGNNVWIGEGVTILMGVKIDDGAVIGAGSVITSDIPKNSIAVGSPAKVIKVFDEDKGKWIRK